MKIGEFGKSTILFLVIWAIEFVGFLETPLFIILPLDGPKFAQGELFDIFWEPKPAKIGSKAVNNSRKCIQVQVPKNLMRRTKLTVSLIKGL